MSFKLNRHSPVSLDIYDGYFNLLDKDLTMLLIEQIEFNEAQE